MTGHNRQGIEWTIALSFFAHLLKKFCLTSLHGICQAMSKFLW